MTVRLHPDDLGMVQVRIERGPSGSVQVEITAEKADTLQAVGPAIPKVSDAMRNATGPIRVDWTFRDLPPEYKTDGAEYDANRTRPLRYLTTAIDTAKGAHNGKDAIWMAFDVSAR